MRNCQNRGYNARARDAVLPRTSVSSLTSSNSAQNLALGRQSECTSAETWSQNGFVLLFSPDAGSISAVLCDAPIRLRTHNVHVVVTSRLLMRRRALHFLFKCADYQQKHAGEVHHEESYSTYQIWLKKLTVLLNAKISYHLVTGVHQ